MREHSCSKVGDDLLKTLWLQRLPSTIQAVLASSSENIERLAVLADSMFGITEITEIQSIGSNQNKPKNVFSKFYQKKSSSQKFCKNHVEFIVSLLLQQK